MLLTLRRTAVAEVKDWFRSVYSCGGKHVAVEESIHHEKVSHALLHEGHAALLLQEFGVAGDLESLKL